MRASIVSSTLRWRAPRTTVGAAICRAARAGAAFAAGAAGVPQASLRAVFRWLNALPTQPIASPPAIGRPTSSCSPSTARPSSPCTSAPRASSWRAGRATRPPKASHVIFSACLRRCRSSAAAPSPSTTAPSSPATRHCMPWPSKPTSVIPIRPGRRAASRTPLAACAATCRARPTSRRSRTDASTRSSAPTTPPRASALTSGPRLKPSPKCCTSNVNPPPRLRGDERSAFYPTRSNTGSVGRSPCALPVIGARGSFDGPASITKSWSSEYQVPLTFAAGAGPSCFT